MVWAIAELEKVCSYAETKKKSMLEAENKVRK
jgi:hypothetical protein